MVATRTPDPVRQSGDPHPQPLSREGKSAGEGSKFPLLDSLS